VSSRTARAIKRNPVLKIEKQTNKQTKKKQTKKCQRLVNIKKYSRKRISMLAEGHDLPMLPGQ
jgi:ribosomal protein S30